MNTYQNPYVRLQIYYSFLTNDDDTTYVDGECSLGVSMIKLEQLTGIPLGIIRQDIVEMLEWQSSLEAVRLRDSDSEELSIQNTLEFPDEDPEYEDVKELYNLEELYDQLIEGKLPSELRDLILSGALDSIPLHIFSIYQNTLYKISLTPEEAQALYSHQALSSFEASYRMDYHVKDSFRSNHRCENLAEHLCKINQAIDSGLPLHLKYRTSDNRVLQFPFRPLKIAYDSMENLYFVLSYYNHTVQVHRLDRIISLKDVAASDIPSCPIPPEDLSFLDIAPNVWGCCFSDPPEHVKVKFFNEANVWEKVKKELSCRTNGQLYEKGEFLFYEDTVYGINKFRSWIYGYGSSAVVLEPESLRKQIIASLWERKKTYESVSVNSTTP